MRRNAALCFMICLLSALTDLLIFRQRYLDQLILYVQYHSEMAGFLRLGIHFLILLCVSTALLTVLRSIPKIGVALQWGCWSLLSISYHVFYEVMHRFPDSQDIRNLLFTPWDMAAGTIGAMVSPLALLKGSLPVLVVLVTLYLLQRGFPVVKKQRKIYQIMEFVLALLVGVLYFLHPTSRHVFFDSLSNSIQIFMQYYDESQYYKIPRQEYIASALPNAPEDNVVLVIDESIRGDYLSINNPSVDTTPVLEGYLRTLPQNMWNYGLALSAGTNSLLSQGAILTGLANLPDKEFFSLRHPTLFQVAKGNRYKTVLVDLQGYFPNVIIRRDDMQYIDETYLKWSDFSHDPKLADIKAAEALHERLEKEKGLFVVLVKWGAHVHYEGRYPGKEKQHQHYLPKLDEGERHTLSKRREIINSFKNAVRFNVDGFFSALLGDLRRISPIKNTTVLWVSDHGQSFQEDGQLEPHSSQYVEQALVPFVLFSTAPWVLEHLRRPEEIKGTLSQLNIYPTLTSIFERRREVRREGFLSLFWPEDWEFPPLFYVSGGALWNSELWKPEVRDGTILLRTEKYMY